MKVILSFLALCIFTISQAATYYISPSGNDATGTGTAASPWKTLSKATSTVTSAGNIIHVTAGTYTETVTCYLSPGVSIEGEGITTTIIKSSVSGQWSAFLMLESQTNGTNGNQSISNITFDGQYVSEANHKTWMGVWIVARNNVELHDMKVINFYDRGVIFDGNTVTDPISAPYYATGNKFYNNTILNSAENNGIYGTGLLNIGGQDGMQVYNNTLIQDQRPNFKNGWPIKLWDNGWLKGCRINNNILVKAPYVGTYPGENGDWDFAIEFFNIQGLEIDHNEIQGSIDLNYNYKGSYAYSAWIHHNNINHAVQNSKVEAGIIFEFRTEAAIVENNIINNKTYGISFNTRGVNNNGGYPAPGGTPAGGYSYIVDNIIRNNLFSNLYGGSGIGNRFAIGVISEGTDDPQINNMQIYNNTMVCKSSDPIGIAIDFTSQPSGNANGIYIRNNIAQGFTSAWLQGSNGNTNMTNAIVTHNDAVGNGNGNAPSWPAGNPTAYTYNNNLAVNPLFVSATNFTLQATSPVIDKGINVGLPYSGAAPDMGYAEYASGGNASPTANAGADQIITLPTSTVSLTGSGIDPDGTITTYAWTKISGPTTGTITNPAAAATSVTALVAGIYKFELKVTDNNGATDTDTMQVTVNAAANIAPTANAGLDQSITLPTNTANLSGSGTDIDGTIATYAWTKISGPTAGTITNPAAAATSVSALVAGIYKFQLTVTDNNGATGKDTMQVTVNAAANIAPTANAGADQTITLPTSTVSLTGSGTDPDGTIATYAWTKISGPTTGTITNPASAATSVTAMVAGVYRFELKVTDNNGATDTDTMQVTVNTAANIVPVANAGADQTVTLPTNAVILSGSGTDVDGIITNYNWTKVSGPAAGTITNPTTAATSVTGLVAGIYKFELRVTDNNGATDTDTMQVTVNVAGNIAPVANAGVDQLITLPTNSVILSGSGTDADGTIAGYAWTKVSGPAAGTISNPTTAATAVTGLVAGVYKFELRVTDNNGATGTDTMQVTVNVAGNIAPTANAGADQSITLPTTTANLSGSGIDPDGTITAYAWTKISGPAAGNITNPTNAATAVTGLVAGIYKFELKVTDNNGAIGRDTMQITVNAAANIAPTANAGADQSITLPTNSVILSGNGTDPDGTITAYAWTKISGPAAGTITNPNIAATFVTGLVAGVYKFELKVTDNNGAIDTDTMQVTVNAATGNIAPVANAGADQSITLPTNIVILSGSGTDADGTITAYSWTKISGPASGIITNPATAATAVTGLAAGIYKFELKVTDDNGATDTDTMQVTVNAAAGNIAPIANAGSDQAITLPTNFVILSGSGTDADGTIAAYVWTKVSGPAAGTITNPTTAATSVTGLVAGIYKFELKVTDNNGAIDTDTMQVTVNAAASNIPPTANAGVDQSITLPINSVILSGSGTDADGTIAAYVWTKVSGPAAGTITNPTTAATSVTGLVAGVYKFELKVTDNNGATDTDTMQVTVNIAANIAPTANAGVDQSITLPTNSVILSGSGTDPDGTITAYAWTKISGPANGTITNPTTAATSVTGLVAGIYKFELKVTDNSGATDTDTMQVVVFAPNIAPTANAGLDQSITLPTNSTNLLGSGNDPDGTIIAYRWTKISGPAAGTITNPASATTTITGLVAGVYRFELKVTDNNGATGTDTMQVTVNPDNIAPTANAGPDQTIILPANNVTLNGSGTDVDGTIVAYAWRQIGGPADKLTSINTATTVLQNLVDGTYKFELTVTDNKGATGKDTVSIIAKQEIAPSQNSINVYPNPVIDYTTVEINTTNNKSGILIVVTDLQGRNVYTKQIPAGRYAIKERINMSSFSKSMYLITVHFSSQDKQTLKALKQ